MPAESLETLETLTYTVPEAALVLNVSQNQIRSMIADGTLRVLPGVGRRQLISKAWLARWVETASDVDGPNGHRADPTEVRDPEEERALRIARPDVPSSTATEPGAIRAHVA